MLRYMTGGRCFDLFGQLHAMYLQNIRVSATFRTDVAGMVEAQIQSKLRKATCWSCINTHRERGQDSLDGDAHPILQVVPLEDVEK